MTLSVAFSRRLAVIGGLFLPIGETVRRWRELSGPIETLLPWLDDLVLGAILLIAAWLSRPHAGTRAPAPGDLNRRPRLRRSSWLTAGWGFVCGAGFGSTLAQLNYIINPAMPCDGDPSGLSNASMVLIKTALVAIGVLGLVASIRDEPEAS
jgi:hypothetical protein